MTLPFYYTNNILCDLYINNNNRDYSVIRDLIQKYNYKNHYYEKNLLFERTVISNKKKVLTDLMIFIGFKNKYDEFAKIVDIKKDYLYEHRGNYIHKIENYILKRDLIREFKYNNYSNYTINSLFDKIDKIARCFF